LKAKLADVSPKDLWAFNGIYALLYYCLVSFQPLVLETSKCILSEEFEHKD